MPSTGMSAARIKRGVAVTTATESLGRRVKDANHLESPSFDNPGLDSRRVGLLLREASQAWASTANSSKASTAGRKCSESRPAISGMALLVKQQGYQFRGKRKPCRPRCVRGRAG